MRMPLVWRLFADVNGKEFSQLLLPQASIESKMVRLTTTRLAMVWSSFLAYNCESLATAMGHEDNIVKINQLVESVIQTCQNTSDTPIPSDPPAHAVWKQIKGETHLCVSVKVWNARHHLLWSIVAPRALRFVTDKNRRLTFKYSGHTDGYRFHGLYANKNVWSSKHVSGYNYRNWRSHFGKEEKLDITKLLGPTIERTDGALPGNSANKSAKLMINIDHVVREGLVETGEEAVKKLFHGQIVHSFDFGIVNTIGIVSGLVMYNDVKNELEVCFARQLVRSKCYYANAGINDHIRSRQRDMQKFADNMKALSVNHARTMNKAEYEKYSRAFDEHGGKILEHNRSVEMLEMQKQLFRNKQRFWSNIRNDLLANADALIEEYKKKRGQKLPADFFDQVKAPLVIIGDGSFGSMKGHRASCPIWLQKYFKRHYLVILVDEYNSSQKCPKCHGQMEEHEGHRIKRCSREGCRHAGKENFLVNRDISAPMNMLFIVAYMLRNGSRPPDFRPKND